jgi:hypothetical protein
MLWLPGGSAEFDRSLTIAAYDLAGRKLHEVSRLAPGGSSSAPCVILIERK